MDQKNHADHTLSVKKLLVSFVICIGIFFLMQAIFSFCLMKIPKFERFFTLTSWICTVALALLFSLIAKGEKSRAILFALICSVMFSLLSISVGLILHPGGAAFWPTLLRHAALIVMTVIFTALFSFGGAKKPKKSKFKKDFKRK